MRAARALERREESDAMNDFFFLLDDVVPAGAPKLEWAPYFERLRAAGAFQGGSAIGGGVCASKRGSDSALTAHLSGYIRIKAADLTESPRELVNGNPVFEAGGTVEIRELPRGQPDRDTPTRIS